MGYTGNKKIGSEPILALLNDPRFDGFAFLEPFVGMGHILRRVTGKSTHTASDLSPYVFHIFKALQRCGHYPHINKKIYQLMAEQRGQILNENAPELQKLASLLSPADYDFTYEEIEAFAALATPQSKPWSGYQGNVPAQRYQYLREQEYVLLLQSKVFFTTQVYLRDYLEYPIHITNTVIYCDAPYISSVSDNKKHYGKHARDFDHTIFWQRIREWSDLSLHNAVFVSEYKAPSDFIAVTQFAKKGTFGKINKEKVFMTKESYHFWYKNT